MKHFKVKKWVRSQTAQKETVTFEKLLLHAKQHKATTKDFHQHKSNGGSCNGNHHRQDQDLQAQERSRPQGQGVTRVRYVVSVGMSHPPRECPVWGKKCHKCGNKNYFNTQCRYKQTGARNRKSCSVSRGHKGRGKPCHSRSRSKSVTKSAYSIESASFQDHSDDLHGRKHRQPPWRQRRPPWKSERRPPWNQFLSRPFGKYRFS